MENNATQLLMGVFYFLSKPGTYLTWIVGINP